MLYYFMLVNTNNLLNILIPKDNKVLKEVLKEADLKGIVNKQASNVKDVIKNLFSKLKNNASKTNDLSKLLKKSSVFKDLGKTSSNINSLLKQIQNEPSLSKHKDVLESFLKDIKNIEAKDIKNLINKSGIFLESKLSKNIKENNLNSKLEKVLTQIKTLIEKSLDINSKTNSTDLLSNKNNTINKKINTIITTLLNTKNATEPQIKQALSNIINNLKEVLSTSKITKVLELNNELEKINKSSNLLSSKVLNTDTKNIKQSNAEIKNTEGKNPSLELKDEKVILNEKVKTILNTLKQEISKNINPEKQTVLNEINKLLSTILSESKNINQEKSSFNEKILRNGNNPKTSTIENKEDLNKKIIMSQKNVESSKNTKENILSSKIEIKENNTNQNKENLKNTIKSENSKENIINTEKKNGNINININIKNIILSKNISLNNVPLKDLLKSVITILENKTDFPNKSILSNIRNIINNELKQNDISSINKIKLQNTSNLENLKNNINALKEVLNTSKSEDKIDLSNILEKSLTSTSLSQKLDLSKIFSSTNLPKENTITIENLFKTIKTLENLSTKNTLIKELPNIKEDLKATLLLMKDEINNSSLGKESLKHIDKLLTQIDYHQLLSLSTNSNHVYLPFIWDMLEDGNISMKELKEDKFFCEINLTLKDMGDIKILLSLYDENKLDITLYANKYEFKEFFRNELPQLKQAINKVSLILNNIKILDLEEKQQKVENVYINTQDLSLGLNIRV